MNLKEAKEENKMEDERIKYFDGEPYIHLQDTQKEFWDAYNKGKESGRREVLEEFQIWKNILINNLKKEGKLKENHNKLDWEYVIDEINGCFDKRLKTLTSDPQTPQSSLETPNKKQNEESSSEGCEKCGYDFSEHDNVDNFAQCPDIDEPCEFKQKQENKE